MNSLARAALGLSLLFLATGCYCCRQDYNPHTGMHYQCRQIGISLFKKECCDKQGPGFEGHHAGPCDGGNCTALPGEYVEEGHEGYFEGPYMEDGSAPQTYYEGAYMPDGTPMPTHPAPLESRPTLLPTPVPTNDANWQSVPPKAPPITQTGYQAPPRPAAHQPRHATPPQTRYRQTVRQ